MRRLALGTLTLLAALLVLVTARALTLGSRQVPVEALPPLAFDEEGALERLSRALQVPTVSRAGRDPDPAAFRALHALLRAGFPATHARLEVEAVAELSLLYVWQGSEPERDPVLLMGHLDVVPADPRTLDAWRHPPFAGVRADGAVWGRGALDDKAGVLAVLEALERLVVDGWTPRRTLLLAFGHDEELGGQAGALRIRERLAERGWRRFACVLDEGGAIAEDLVPGRPGRVAVVGVAEKGGLQLALEVEGPGGHASTPPRRTNVGRLARAIDRLESDPFPLRIGAVPGAMFAHLAPEMPFVPRLVFANRWLFGPLVLRRLAAAPETRAMLHTTVAVTVVEGGHEAGALPARARAVLNLRILPGESVEACVRRVREVIDDDAVRVTVEGESREPSPVSDTDGPAFRLLARTIREVAGEDVVVAPYLVMGGTDARHYAADCPRVYRFLPIVMRAGDMARMHGVDERLHEESYLLAVRFYHRFLSTCDELP